MDEELVEGQETEETEAETPAAEGSQSETGRDLRREVEEFLEAFPQVEAGDIPQEVWRRAAEGQGLARAYAMYENAQLRVQLEALRQNGANRERSLGSLGSSQRAREGRSVEEYWDEAE